MKLRYSKPQFKYLICLFIFSVVLVGGEYPNLTVEDLYGEWRLDSLECEGHGKYTMTYEEALEFFSYPIYIGKDVYVDRNKMVERMTWIIDTTSLDTRSSSFCSLFSCSFPPELKIYGSADRWPKTASHYIFPPAYIRESRFDCYAYYKKIDSERSTDFSRPLLPTLLGRWEVLDMRRQYSPAYPAMKLKKLFGSPIEFTKYGFIDYQNEYHSVTYELDSLSSDFGFRYCFEKLPDSVQANLGAINQVRVFSDEGYLLNMYEISESGILVDYYDYWLIFYLKQPPPLKKQGEQTKENW